MSIRISAPQHRLLVLLSEEGRYLDQDSRGAFWLCPGLQRINRRTVRALGRLGLLRIGHYDDSSDVWAYRKWRITKAGRAVLAERRAT